MVGEILRTGQCFVGDAGACGLEQDPDLSEVVAPPTGRARPVGLVHVGLRSWRTRGRSRSEALTIGSASK